MKYIRFEVPETGTSFVMAFSGHVLHEEVKRMVAAVWPGYKPVSAAKVRVDESGGVGVYGHSHSLKLEPDHDIDQHMLEYALKRED